MVRRPFLSLVALLALGSALADQPPDTAAPGSGRAHFAAGRYAEAEAAFSLELQRGRTDPSLHFNRALCRLNLGNHPGALSDLDAFLALVPGSADGLILRAKLRLFLGNAAGAADDAGNALALRPDDPGALELRASASARLGRTAEARADFDRLLALDPQHLPALLSRADLHEAAGDDAAAESDLVRAVAIAPDRAEALHRLGLLRFRRLELPAAVRLLTDAARLAPRDASVARALGYAHYAAGDFAAAAEVLRRTVELDPARSTYARLLLHFAGRRLPSPPPLPPAVTVDDPWPTMLARFAMGEVGEEELLLSAQNLAPAQARQGRLCEANFYLGTHLLLAGDLTGARHYLEESVASSQTAFAEHTLARAELSRLPAAPAPERQRPARRR